MKITLEKVNTGIHSQITVNVSDVKVIDLEFLKEILSSVEIYNEDQNANA